METGSSSRQRAVVKKPKVSSKVEEQEEEKKRDRISNLPDIILHRIFSFLDMKVAVRASILSKRWRHLWTSLPHLNFFNDVHLFEKDTHRLDFVDRVFLLRDTSSSNTNKSKIQTLHFRICSPSLVPPSLNIIKGHLTTWIFAAIKSSVQHLSVEILPGYWHELSSTTRQRNRRTRINKEENLPPFKFPDCLFTSKTLMSLELKTIHKDSSYQLPFKTCLSANSIISLPLLKTLHLASLTLIQGSCSNDNFITKMVSSCPVLESLIIKDCEFHCCTTSINISSFKLKHLVIEKCSVTCNSAEVVVDLPVEVEFKLNTPYLISFSLKDCMSKNYTVEKLPSLLKANIDLAVEVEHDSGGVERNNSSTSNTQLELPEERKRLYAQHMIKFLKALQFVEDLILSPCFIEFVSGAADAFELHTWFWRLKRLELKTWFSRDCIRSIASLLQICRIIETLSIEVIRKTPTESMRYGDKTNLDSLNTGDCWEPGLSMVGTPFRLKVVKFRGYFGGNELKFLEFLLKNARELEKLMITYNGHDYQKKRATKFAEMLHAFPRASSRITIMFF